jgi:predicted nucleic acid-binding protein
MRVIVSDTSPLRYLVLVGEEAILPKLFGGISIPDAVASELQAERTPEIVRQWVRSNPPFLEFLPDRQSADLVKISEALGRGERQAIALALEKDAQLVLMDERSGVHEARGLGLNVTGTLGILARAADLQLVDLPRALDRLQQTNFRMHPKLLQAMREGRF